MNTHRETILLAVQAALTGSTPAGEQVFRSRAEALARDELPAIIIKPGAEVIEQSGAGIMRINLDIKIEIHTRGNPADSVADTIHAPVHNTLSADRTLGGRVQSLQYQGAEAPEFDDGDDTACRLTLNYNAIYLAAINNIATHL